MKMKFKKSVVALAALMTTSALLPTHAFAAEKKQIQPEVETNVIQVTPETYSTKANEFITFDKATNMYIIDYEGLSKNLSSSDYNTVVAQVADTNALIQNSLQEKDKELNITAVDNNGEEVVLQKAKSRKAGVNDVKYYWNYCRVFMNARTVRIAVQVGCLIASLRIESQIVLAILGFGSIAASEVTNGIWFDYNHFYGLLCGNWGWQ